MPRVALTVALTVALAGAAPLFHGCLDDVSRALPYCNTSVPVEDRVSDVIARLNVTEKIGLLSPHDPPYYCGCLTAPVPRIGLPGWKWLTEVNTNAGFCSDDGARCSTVFVGPNNFAASFNRSLWWAKGDVISDELRAHNNLGDRNTSLSGYGPNINLVKDPRYGRNSELPGEDPFLSGSYATAYLRGMQQRSARGHLKMLAMVKHYTAYSKEAERFEWGADVAMFDMFDSYLPQYEMAFRDGNASGAMCSYFAANGVPSCGSKWLLDELVRGAWARPDATFMSDCSAVANFIKFGFAANETDASAKALSAGLDLYGGWGDAYWTDGYLEAAIDAGMTSEAALDAAVRRALTQRMLVGAFDPLDEQPWTELDGACQLNASKARRLAYEAGAQGLVLLKNQGGALPLARGARVAVVGPLAVETVGLRSDYAGWARATLPPSIADAIAASNAGGATLVAKGVDVNSTNASSIDAALALVAGADATVVVLGNTPDQEHEGIDRDNTRLPGLQADFAARALAVAKKAGAPAVVVLVNGGIVSIDALVEPAPAIIEAFNPIDHGTRALAETLFGAENRWGKLPVTIYGENYTVELDAAGAGISDYSLSRPPGRSYRYYTGEPLFPFGHGLSYTSFAHACDAPAADADGALAFNCTVENTGDRAGDEVVMVFHRCDAPTNQTHPVPLKQLVAFERVSLEAGASATVHFALAPDDALAVTADDGSKVVYPGAHALIVSRGHGDDQVMSVQV